MAERVARSALRSEPLTCAPPPESSGARSVLGRIPLRRVPGGASTSRPPVARAQGSPNLQRMRVLAVEDDADLRALFKLQLELCGATVGVAASCREAKASLAGGDWDLMIADIGLPDGSGYELARFAHSLRHPPSCVAISGRASPDDVDEARRAGFRLHLTKPCDPSTLARVAEQFRAKPR